MTEMCPKCKARRIPFWAKSFAIWPFTTHCRNCGTRLRVKIPFWQNALVQILGQVVFWATLFLSIKSGIGGVVVGATVGFVLAMLIAMIPGLFAKLEEIKVPTKF